MVLKVDNASTEETKPILGCHGELEKGIPDDLKFEDTYKHNITNSMQTDLLKIDRLDMILDLFASSIKTQNILLAKQCTDVLNMKLNKHNALLILLHMYDCQLKTSTNIDPFNVEPSAPPINESENHYNEDMVLDLIDNLRNNCLLEIDKNGDFILQQKEILKLSYSDILAITTRDTLQVSNEMLVYNAVMRWAVEECKRRTLDPHFGNQKTVLRELVHAPRYGLMTKKEFMSRTVDGIKGPRRSGILEEKEVEIIQSYIKKKAKNRPVDELPHKASLPRKIIDNKSRALHSGVSADSACSVTSSCDKFVINFLTCWTAIFD